LNSRLLFPPWGGAALNLTLGAIGSSFDSALLAYLSPPILLSALTPFLDSASQLTPIGPHFPSITTPFDSCVSMSLSTLNRISPISTAVGTILATLLPDVCAVFAALAPAIGSRVAPVLPPFRTPIVPPIAPEVAPVGAPMIPGALAIVAVPIRTDGESNDRYIHTWTIHDQRSITIRPVGREIVG
jgi:hypothetical protein